MKAEDIQVRQIVLGRILRTFDLSHKSRGNSQDRGQFSLRKPGLQSFLSNCIDHILFNGCHILNHNY